jgi:hypothetical protein
MGERVTRRTAQTQEPQPQTLLVELLRVVGIVALELGTLELVASANTLALHAYRYIFPELQVSFLYVETM